MARLEHVNITVTDPETTARMLCEVFNWDIRWNGPSSMGGHTYHVGRADDYVAVYTKDGAPDGDGRTGRFKGGLNHVGIAVDDLDATAERVRAAGFEPFNFGSYEPGRRFYFLDHDDIEFEVVCYQ